LCWLTKNYQDSVAFVSHLRDFVTFGYASLPREPAKYRLPILPSANWLTLGSIQSGTLFYARCEGEVNDG
jgi:hypothetical protein